jgi:hypothetical protein
MGGHGRALGPAEIIHQGDDPCASRWPLPIGGLTPHDAGDVLAGNPALLVARKGGEFTAVQRKRVDFDQRFVGAGGRVGDFA